MGYSLFVACLTWLQTLDWFEDPNAPLQTITTLELLCNLVVMPPTPVQHPRGGVDYLDFRDPVSRMTPTALRAWLQSLTTAAKQLARQTSSVLLPPTASRKVCGLQAWGVKTPGLGFARLVGYNNQSRQPLYASRSYTVQELTFFVATRTSTAMPSTPSWPSAGAKCWEGHSSSGQ